VPRLATLAHRPQIVLGVLEIVLGCDVVAGRYLGAGEREVSLVVLLRILDRARLGKAKPESIPSGLGFSRHWVAAGFVRVAALPPPSDATAGEPPRFRFGPAAAHEARQQACAANARLRSAPASKLRGARN
jgi:hypothetical protein